MKQEKIFKKFIEKNTGKSFEDVSLSEFRKVTIFTSLRNGLLFSSLSFLYEVIFNDIGPLWLYVFYFVGFSIGCYIICVYSMRKLKRSQKKILEGYN